MNEWAKEMEVARRIERLAKDTFVKALEMRCTSQVGDNRCTADALPPHEHRYRHEDLPEYAQ